MNPSNSYWYVETLVLKLMKSDLMFYIPLAWTRFFWQLNMNFFAKFI
jgi:hypothetical protein